MDIKEYEYLPTSPVIDDLICLLVAAPNIGLLSDIRKTSAGRGVNIRKGDEGNPSRVVTFASKSSTVYITIPEHIDLRIGTNPARNILIMLLILMAKQCLENGVLYDTKIKFTLKDLVSLGFYSSTHTARVGFEHAMRILLNIQIAWTTNKKKQTHGRVLFTAYDIENSKCTVTVNSEIDWSYIVRFYTLLPNCFPSLPLKAAVLLYTVMYLLRQNINTILTSQDFSVRLSTIMIRLALPSLLATKNPKRDVLVPLQEAVSQINAAVQENDLRLEISAPEGSKTTEILDNGKMIIHVGGTPLEYCESIPQRSRAKD